MCVSQPALGRVLLAKHLAHQLLPAITALGHCRVGITFFQRANIRVLLQRGVVGAGGGGEKIARDPAR